MKSYKTNTISISKLKINQSKEGETIEQKIARILTNKEPIKDGAPLIYTDRKDGVKPETNIRTDRFDVALEATTKIKRSYQGRREERAKAKEAENDNKNPGAQHDPGEGGKA